MPPNIPPGTFPNLAEIPVGLLQDGIDSRAYGVDLFIAGLKATVAEHKQRTRSS